MSGLVAWRDSDVPEQVFGKMGSIDVFIIGRDSERGGLILAARDLGGISAGSFGFGDTQYESLQDAQAAAERKAARILANLDKLKSDLTSA